MAQNDAEKKLIQKEKNGVPTSRTGRVIWLTVAVIFLSLAAVVIWTWAHTDARPVHRFPQTRGGRGSTVEETETAPPPSRPLPTAGTVAEPHFPSPFRSPQAATETATESLPAPDTVPLAEGDGRDGELIYHGRRNGRMEIALSFDDGPHPRYTPMILAILQEYGIHATFFMVGENVGYYPEAAAAVAAAGHEIGNHTFTHRKFNLMNEHDMLSEISACEDAIASVSKQKPRFIRPPEGNLNATMRRVIGSLDYRIVLWDVDTRDWAHTPPSVIAENILDTVQAGDIILMHDFIGHDSPTPEALRRVIPALLERGYHFVTVGELVDGVE